MAVGLRRAARILAALAFSGVAPVAAGPFRGFTHCAPPLRPACVDKALTQADVIACDGDMQLFTSMVFKYRECLEMETERAVRDANDAIEAWRCRSDKTNCRN